MTSSIIYASRFKLSELPSILMELLVKIFSLIDADRRVMIFKIDPSYQIEVGDDSLGI